MCLAVPGRIVETYRDGELSMARVAFGGIARTVCLEHVPEARVGDYVLVHVGFALTRIDEAEALRLFELLKSIIEPDDLPPPSDETS